jgi:hypothetical protein
MKDIIESVFGNKLEYFLPANISMPLYLTDNRRFYRVKLCDIEFMLVEFLKNERFNVSALSKQMAQYEKGFSLPVAFGFHEITSFQRQALIKNDIPFVSGNNQIYLPFIGASFTKIRKHMPADTNSNFTPTTQTLFLLLLYTSDGLHFSKIQAARALNTTSTSIARAVKQLGPLQLVKCKKNGREILLSRPCPKTDYFKKARENLINPVQHIYYYFNDDGMEKKYTAGEMALSERSSLGYPEFTEYAVYRDLPAAGSIQEEKIPYTGRSIIRLQKWSYDMSLFAQNGKLDPVSLICSFSGNKDERINKCLKEIEKEIPSWQIEMQS